MSIYELFHVHPEKAIIKKALKPLISSHLVCLTLKKTLQTEPNAFVLMKTLSALTELHVLKLVHHTI